MPGFADDFRQILDVIFSGTSSSAPTTESVQVTTNVTSALQQMKRLWTLAPRRPGVGQERQSAKAA
jgi:hypothetical protein